MSVGFIIALNGASTLKAFLERQIDYLTGRSRSFKLF